MILPIYAEDFKEKSAELNSVRNEIEDIKSSIENARLETDILQTELKENETSIGNIALHIREIEKQLQQKINRLNDLNNKKSLHEKILTEQKRTLAKQIRAAYMISSNDYMKLLLNYEDLAMLGRALAYYNYHNKTKVQKINLINTEIEKITQIEKNIKHENDILLTLKKYQLEKNREISYSKKERENILAKLLNELDKQGLKLQALQHQEQETKNLLQKIISEQTEENRTSMALFENIPPFNTLKGKLNWPTKGKLLTRFGNRKQGGKLKWQGVIINAEIGVDVQAVSGGQVVFADWFRNLGLLIIIDHGDGYMSLYGYNQSLLKKTGDWVLPNEIISFAGNSGGQLRSGIYFEIRNNGSPVNPEKWCRN